MCSLRVYYEFRLESGPSVCSGRQSKKDNSTFSLGGARLGRASLESELGRNAGANLAILERSKKTKKKKQRTDIGKDRNNRDSDGWQRSESRNQTRCKPAQPGFRGQPHRPSIPLKWKLESFSLAVVVDTLDPNDSMTFELGCRSNAVGVVG